MVIRQQDPIQIGDRAGAAYDQALQGYFAGSDRVLADLAGLQEPWAMAWRAVLLAQRWHAEPDRGEVPVADELLRWAEHEAVAQLPAALACSEMVRRAVLRHDVDELAMCVALYPRLCRNVQDARVRVGSQLATSWLALARGEAEHADDCAQQCLALAMEHKQPSAVIEATVIRALCADVRDDTDNATTLARRGWRMARTEDLPQWQYMASIVLARVRRSVGTPHLAIRMLRPLAKVAPPPWGGWIAWEASMSGALSLAGTVRLGDDNDPNGQARMLRTFLMTAHAGDGPAFVEASARLTKNRPAWPSRANDLALAHSAVDSAVRVSAAPEHCVPWLSGEVAAAPQAIKGLCMDVSSSASDPSAAVFVVAHPHGAGSDARARRVAGLGERVAQVDASIARVRGKSERTPTTLAVIALAGRAGVGRADLFRAVYGFEYQHDLHRNLFKALMYRVRKAVGDWGEVTHVEHDHFGLELHCRVLIPEPRLEQPLVDIVARTIARMGATSAKDAAAQLGVPLRTAQSALRQLVEDGALSVEKEGRLVRYSVEDTTFSEPTRWS